MKIRYLHAEHISPPGLESGHKVADLTMPWLLWYDPNHDEWVANFGCEDDDDV